MLVCRSKGSLIMSHRSCKHVFLMLSLLVFCLSALDARVEKSYGQYSVGALQPFWNITYGGSRADEGWGVALDAEHNVYFAGFDRIAAATANVFLRKLTPDGVSLWNASWGGPFDDEAFVVTVRDGYVYVGGRAFTSFSLASSDMFILRFYAVNGSLAWSQTWDGGHGYDEVDGLVAEGNSLYVAGWTTGASTQNDFAVLKYDVNGTLLWSRSWGTAGWDEANGQIGVDENCIYVAGRYDAPSMTWGGDAVLVAFNKTDGSYLWHTTWGGDNIDDAFGLTIDSSYIYSVGITSSFNNSDFIFLLKYDKTGSLMWNATWGGSGSELARSATVNADSSYVYVAGSTTSFGNGDFDVVLLKYDQNGNLTLNKTWGGSKLDRSRGIAADASFIYIAGDTKSIGAGDEDAFLIKVDSDGGNSIPEFDQFALPLLLFAVSSICLVLHKKRGEKEHKQK